MFLFWVGLGLCILALVMSATGWATVFGLGAVGWAMLNA